MAFFSSSSVSISLFSSFISFIFKTRTPPGIKNGLLKSPIFNVSIFFLISLLREFSLIQPKLPPTFTVSAIL